LAGTSRRWLRLVPGLLGLALIATLIARSDLATVKQLLQRSPWTLAVLCGCYLAGALCDAAGWTALIASPSQLGLRNALGLHVGMDSLAFSLPSGNLIAEGAAFAVLRRRGIPRPEALRGLLWRRGLLSASHATILLSAALLAPGALVVRFGSPALLPAVALIFFFVMAVTLVLLVRKGPRLWSAPGLPSARALWAAPPFAATWLVDVLETWLVLRLLGAPLPLLSVLPAESLLSLVRAVAVFVPAGLGLQDVGYAAFLASSGVDAPEALAAAFVLLKRSKEAIVVLIGYLWLGLGTRRGEPAPLPA
jgi:hypothetical protein